MKNELEQCQQSAEPAPNSLKTRAASKSPSTKAAGECALSKLAGQGTNGDEPVRFWKLRPPVLSYACIAASALGILVVCLVVYTGAVNDSSRFAGRWGHLLLIICNIFLWMGAAGGIHAFHLPRYVAANAKGIAFRTLWRWRAFVWSDIVWAEFGPMVNVIRLSNGRIIPIRFLTLRDEALTEIRSLILSQAELTIQDRRGRGTMYRRSDPFLDW